MAQFRDRPIPAPEPLPMVDDLPEGQWDHYDDTTLPPSPEFIPPATPAGRQYMAYRQPPTWQHASIAGLGDASAILQAASGFAQIAAGAGIGYWFTREWRGAAAGGLAVFSAGQIVKMNSSQLLIGLAALGGAYYLVREPGRPLFAAANEEEEEEEEEEEYEVPSPKPTGNRRWLSKKNASVSELKHPWMQGNQPLLKGGSFPEEK